MTEFLTNSIDSIKGTLNGHTIPAILYIIALILLFVLERKNVMTKIILWFHLILTVVFFFPVTAKIIMYGIGTSVYWRLLWLYPAVLIMAVSAVAVAKRIQNKGVAGIFIIFCAAIFVLTGQNVVSRENFDRAYNYEKLPQYVIGVCDIINEDANTRGITEKKLATSVEFLVYVRQYDATLKMENSRDNIRGYDKRENANFIYGSICGNDVSDYDKLVDVLREEQCNYVVLNMDYQTKTAEELQTRGFFAVGDYEQFRIFWDDVYGLEEVISQNQVVSSFQSKEEGYLIGQYASVTGQQSSFYTITDNKGHLIVIDGGWAEDADYVKAVIEYFGGEVDAWIITHPHFDHMRAFNTLITRSDCPEIDKVYVSDFDYDTYEKEAKEWDQIQDYETFLEATKNATNIEYLHAGDSLDICGLQVDVYHGYESKEEGDACNDGSLVFEVTADKESMLFCGDTGKAQADVIIAKFKEQLSADYLQMGHHGNGGLTEEFYRLVSPKAAFFDAPEWLMNPGEDTKYTTPQNRELMESLGAEIYYFSSAPNFIVLN